MPSPVKPIPEGFRTLTPNLVSTNAAAAIEFYKKVFGAVVTVNMPGPDGKVMHAELKIGDSLLFINDTMNPDIMRPSDAGKSNLMYLHVYVANVDEVFKRALAAGSIEQIPVQDMFWGDRYGKLMDPFGQQWGIATHTEDVAPDEMKRRMQAMSANAAG